MNGKVCKGDDLKVNAVNLNSAVPATSFTWDAGTANGSSTVINNVTEATTVALTVATAAGCTQELKATYGVIDAPKFTVDAPSNVCAMEDVVVSANVEGAVDPADYTYSWSVDPNMTSDIKNGQTYTFDNVVANNGASGFDFYATVKDKNYGCTSTIVPTSVNVVTPGNPLINYVDRVCEGESTEIELTGTSNSSDLTGYTFWIKTPEMTEFTNEISMKEVDGKSVVTHTTGPITKASRYEYYVLLNHGDAICKSGTSSVVINVESKPNIQVQEYGSPCSGQELTLKASAYGVESNGILWSANKGVTEADNKYGPDLTVTNQNGILVVTDYTQSVTATKLFTQKQYSGGNVVNENKNKTCSQTLNYKYKTYPLPQINVFEDATASSHCPGSSVYFDAQAVTENLKSITWSGNNVNNDLQPGDTILGQRVSITMPLEENIPLDANGKKILHTQLSYTVSNDRCSNTGSVDVRIDTTPGFTLRQIEPIASDYGHNKKNVTGSALKFCENSKIVLDVLSDITGDSIIWRGGVPGTGGRHEYTQSGTYDVTVVDANNGCKSNMLFTIDMEMLPSISAGIKGVNAKNNYCYVDGNDKGLQIDVATSSDAYCYVSLDEPEVPPFDDEHMKSESKPEGWMKKNNRLECNPEKSSWVYAYAISNSDLKCVNKTQKWVEVHKSPIVSIVGDKVACAGKAIELSTTYNSPENAEAVSYTWMGNGISGMTGESISAQGMSSGKNTISVVVTDENQCQGQDTVEVKILATPQIQLSVDGAPAKRKVEEVKFCDGASKTVVPSCWRCDEEYQLRDFKWQFDDGEEKVSIKDADGKWSQHVTVSKRGSYKVQASVYAVYGTDTVKLCNADPNGFNAIP
ncbi:MAG: hypothetical protein UE068_11995, partial [Paludibacteraceae bacterium]|nr:hypothetical protein [Paludibacteraceae bacterium]